MLDGLRSFFSSPYLAPLTEPVKNVARFTMLPIRDFVDVVRNSFEGDYTEWPSNFSDKLSYAEEYTSVIAIAGGLVTGIGGLIGGGAFGAIAASTTATAVMGGIAGAVAGAALGVIAGPFVGAAAVGFGALVVGSVIGIVPGVIAGTAKMLKHVFSKKPDAPETSAPANDDSELADVLPARIIMRSPKTAAEMMQSFSTLQSEERKAFETIMMDHLRPAFEAASAVALPKSAVELPKDTAPAFENKGAAFGKIGKLVV